jgi:N-acyl-L-homoserine lactone synthetase
MRVETGIHAHARPQHFDWNATTLSELNGREAIEGGVIDNDPLLMDLSYRLRYQVYCVERGFLNAGDYPEQLERDEFDRFSLHIGVMDGGRDLIATSRLVKVSMAGLPLFRHCGIFPHEDELYREENRIAEISRLCMSRDLRDGRAGGSRIALSLYRATYQASKRFGLTHWLVAMEPSLHRLLSALGVPFRAIGPVTDYFGPVAPYVCDLHEFDEIILSRRSPRLLSFLDGLEPQFHPGAFVGVA